MYHVKDAMNDCLISIPPDATLEDAIHVLLDHGISGAPVIDDHGRLCGIITQFQLLEVLYDPNIKNHCVKDCMTRDVLTIEDSALLGAAASMFVVHRIRRIPVIRDGVVAGIISRSDLLRYFVKTGEQIDSFFAKLRKTTADSREPVTAA
jgi:predicted transcriptional regulator